MIEPHHPSWRKPFGMFLILAIIALWAVIIASFSGEIATLPGWLQLPIYIFAGIIWIAPLKPLLAWMETGRWFPRDGV
jgi:predicted membrane channel-forming protein YqfA (hemolysin III family)